MVEVNDDFYVVRKGDMIGVYKSLSDLQAVVQSSGDSPLSLYKGKSLSRSAEEYLNRMGLKNPMYSLDIGSVDVMDAVFGQVIPTNYLQDHPGSSTSTSSSYCCSCVLNFGGVSKGNPGESGAGAVLRSDDGSKVFRLREGVGDATNNVAHYRAIILGLKFALQKGFKHIHAQGHAELVVRQTQGQWNKRNNKMVELSKLVKELQDQFLSFQINYIKQAFNREAIDQAYLGIDLKDGRVQVECDTK